MASADAPSGAAAVAVASLLKSLPEFFLCSSMLVGEMAFMAMVSVSVRVAAWCGGLSRAAHMGMTSQRDQSLCAAVRPDAKMRRRHARAAPTNPIEGRQ